MDTLKIRLHLFGALVATLCMAAFFITTIAVELMGNPEAIATLKGYIVVPGLFILIPALGLAGSSGFSLANRRKGRLLKAKQRRMPIIVVVLLPAAILLDQWASSGVLDGKFYLLQAVELIAAMVNLSLMGMNIRDGLRLREKRPVGLAGQGG